MFETSLLPERKGKDARLIRGIAFGSIAVQVVSVATFVIAPLIYPDTLPSMIRPPKLTRVELKRPEVKIVPVKPQPVVTQSAVAMPARLAHVLVEIRRAGIVSRAPVSSEAEPALALGGGNVMGASLSAAVGPGSPMGSGTSAVIVKPAVAAVVSSKPLAVSTGVSRGLLIEPIRPLYPTIARAARQQGTVVVTAVIDRTGRIVNAQVTEGPAMLREAAISAVREARYRPYMLNGQPTEVLTTFSIVFQLGA